MNIKYKTHNAITFTGISSSTSIKSILLSSGMQEKDIDLSNSIRLQAITGFVRFRLDGKLVSTENYFILNEGETMLENCEPGLVSVLPESSDSVFSLMIGQIQ